MKLIKEHSGEYKGEVIIDGIKITLEVSSLEGRGFTFSYYANGHLVYDDGWYGLRLKDIKSGINNHIEQIIEEYKQKNY